MAKYGIGAKVRDVDGDVAEVIGKRKGVRVLRYSGGKLDGLVVEFPKSSLVPANDQEVALPADKVLAGQGVSENACGWVPKVGDRVRFKEAYSGKTVGDEVVLTEVERAAEESDGYLVSYEENSCFSRRLEPVVAPATTDAASALTITAGKFYRTRDGRKVLVRVNVGGEMFPFSHDNGGGGFHGLTRDGKSCVNLDAADLVAEWVEPAPAVEEVAVAESTAMAADEAPKFKDGQKVRCINSSWGSTYQAGKIYEVRKASVGHISTVLDSVGSTTNGWGDHNFEAIEEPAAPPAKFKVGDRVRFLHDDDTATISAVEDGKYRVRWPNGEGGSVLWDADDFEHLFNIGSTVTFTATGRLSAINENGHYQVTFPGLAPARNSFALPADYVSLAN